MSPAQGIRGHDKDRKSFFPISCLGPCKLGHCLVQNLKDTGGEILGEKAQTHKKQCCSLTAFSDSVFPGQDSAAAAKSVPLVLGRTNPGDNFITSIRSYSCITVDLGGLGGLGKKSHLSKGHSVNIYSMLGYRDE